MNIALDINSLVKERETLSEFLASPDAYADKSFTSKNKRFNELESLIELAKRREQLAQNINEARQLAGGNDELAELAKQELIDSEAELTSLEENLFIMLTPKDPNDEKNIIIEIRAGAGGDEASLFAAEL